MKKYIKYIVIVIILLVIFSLVNKYLQPSVDTEIEKVLLEKGFVESEYENLYVKEESNTKKYSFSTSDYTYMVNVEDVNGLITSSLNATYSFSGDSIIYSYRLTSKDTYNTLFKGTYDGENFSCEKEFSNAGVSSSEKENMCTLIETNVRLFYTESKTLFSNYKLIQYMKQK